MLFLQKKTKQTKHTVARVAESMDKGSCLSISRVIFHARSAARNETWLCQTNIYLIRFEFFYSFPWHFWCILIVAISLWKNSHSLDSQTVRMNVNSCSFICLIFKNKFKGLFKKVFGERSAPKGGSNSAERIAEVQKAKVRLTLMGHQCPIFRAQSNFTT